VEDQMLSLPGNVLVSLEKTFHFTFENDVTVFYRIGFWLVARMEDRAFQYLIVRFTQV
jgi:hypothetical protein